MIFKEQHVALETMATPLAVWKCFLRDVFLRAIGKKTEDYISQSSRVGIVCDVRLAVRRGIAGWDSTLSIPTQNISS